jgi:hypothetical protein
LVAFFIQVNVVDVDLLFKRRKRIVKIRDSVSSLLRTHIIQSLDPVVASADFVGLILALLLEGVVEVLVQAFKLFFKFCLVCLQRLIHLLALIDCILLDVLDFSEKGSTG